MTWEETVIDTIPIIDKWLSGELENDHVAPAIAEAQAKYTWDIAFDEGKKAAYEEWKPAQLEAEKLIKKEARLEGIREVVEWIAENRIVSSYWQWEDNEDWQAKLKGWE